MSVAFWAAGAFSRKYHNWMISDRFHQNAYANEAALAFSLMILIAA
jgi:hypothetical protein